MNLPASAPGRPGEADPRPAWLTLGRTVWAAVTILTLGLVVAGVPSRYFLALAQAQTERLTLLRLGLSQAAYAGYVTALDMIVVLAHLAVAIVVFRLCKADWVLTLVVEFALVTNGALIPLTHMYGSIEVHPLLQVLINTVIYIGLVSGTSLLYVFPDGRFVPDWTRWILIGWAAAALGGAFWPEAPFSFGRWPVLVQILMLLVLSGVGVFAQIHRYEHAASRLQRQQTKWAAIGLLAAVVGPFAYFLPYVILPSLSLPAPPNFMRNFIGSNFFSFSLALRLIGTTAFSLTLLLLPLSFAVAILRYRLWDIDIIIRRTLIYGALTGLLTLIYLLSVVLLQEAFRALTGEVQNQFVTVASTLAIAALFLPLRQWVQGFIDRRFYRRKYDTARTLAEFAATARDETDLNALAARLVQVVDETMEPESVDLWLKPMGEAAETRRRGAPERDTGSRRAIKMLGDRQKGGNP